MRTGAKKRPSFAAVSLCFGVAFVAVHALQWPLTDLLTPFCVGPLLLAVKAALALLIVGAIVYWLIGLDDPIWNAVPLAINIGALLIVLLVPFTAIWLDAEFRAHRDEYHQVVELVEAGAIQPESHYLASLPPEYRHLSRGGGEIMIDTRDGVTRVFFFTFAGVLDNFSGFIYRSDDNPPQAGDFGADWQQVEQKRAHWYFGASY